MQITVLKSKKDDEGFTILELLVVVSIIGLLASIIFISFRGVRTEARDAERVSTLQEVQNALERYYSDYGRYPSRDATGVNYGGFTYNLRDASGACTINDPDLRFDNSASLGFLLELFELGYTKNGYWNDPLKPELGNSYNCRYVVPAAEQAVDNIQRYLLHCNLEKRLDLERQDGGTNDTIYEVFSADPWICIGGYYN